MRLTNFSDLSFRVLLFAAARRDRVFTIDEMNSFYCVSRGHLAKVVNALTREGYLSAIRGRSGGLRLGFEPEMINLGEVLRKTEPSFALVECMHPGSKCALVLNCKLPKPLEESLEAFMATLSRYTLADILLEETAFPPVFAE